MIRILNAVLWKPKFTDIPNTERKIQRLGYFVPFLPHLTIYMCVYIYIYIPESYRVSLNMDQSDTVGLELNTFTKQNICASRMPQLILKKICAQSVAKTSSFCPKFFKDLQSYFNSAIQFFHCYTSTLREHKLPSTLFCIVIRQLHNLKSL